MNKHDVMCFLVGFLLTLVVIIGVNYQGTCDIKTLINEAPETLLLPKPEQFASNAHYLQALVRFQEHGTWAVLEDGTICTL